MNKEITTRYKTEVILETKYWVKREGLWWNWKLGYRTLNEAYQEVIADKIIKGFTK